MKKISELTDKEFLGEDGAVENSYVLVNYAEDAGDTPVTYKATIEELGKAIVTHLNIPLTDEFGLLTLDASDDTYDALFFSNAVMRDMDGRLVYYEGDSSSGIGITLQNLYPIEHEEVKLYPVLLGDDNKYYTLDDSGVPSEITL